MSTSIDPSTSSAPPSVVLEVDAVSPAIEIFIIDGLSRRVAKGIHVLQAQLPPGIYRIKFKAGRFTTEKTVFLEPDQHFLRVMLDIAELGLTTATPLKSTNSTHEYHMAAAVRHSQATDVAVGEGSELLVFVRDVDKVSDELPEHGLSLYDATGRELLAFKDHGERFLGVPGQPAPWYACNVRLNPGHYILGLQMEDGRKLSQTVVCSEGWSTRYFALRRPYDSEWAANLADAAISMERIGIPFVPNNPQALTAELARQALADGRLADQGEAIERMIDQLLNEKLVDPMLGIYGAHCLSLTQKEEHSFERLRVVVKNLNKLLGEHPDIAALEVFLDDRLSQFDTPPMLRNSWRLIVNASAQHTDIIPHESFSAEIALKLWGSGTWLTWEEEPGLGLLNYAHISDLTDVAHAGGVEVQSFGSDYVPPTYQAYSPSVENAPLPELLQAIAQEAQLTQTESAIFSYTAVRDFFDPEAFKSHKMISAHDLKAKVSQNCGVGASDHWSMEEIVSQFGLPYSTVVSALSGIHTKLEPSQSMDFADYADTVPADVGPILEIESETSKKKEKDDRKHKKSNDVKEAGN